jgi:hypothetical protein
MIQDRLIRVIYGIEFLLALVAALLFWNYVGGPTHLDYVPWAYKGLLPLGIAGSVVRITMSANRIQAGKWIVLLCILMVGCGLLSYYAHLNEPQDTDDDSGQVVPTALGRT